MLTQKLTRSIRTLLITLPILLTVSEARAGVLFALNQQNASFNQIHAFGVNESTGALTLLAGFPVSSGGTGINSVGGRQITVDRANQRLYVVNDGSDTVTGFSINPATGALTPLPFSPILLPTGIWATVTVHPSGSPLLVTRIGGTPAVASYSITATTATPAPGSPFTTNVAAAAAAEFSRDGNFFYAGGSATNTFSVFGVNSATGALSPISAPIASGFTLPNGFATDSKGRLFIAGLQSSAVAGFAALADGTPLPFSGNPFPTSASNVPCGVLHPNERFYYACLSTTNSMMGFQITGDGSATAMTALAGAPVASGGAGPVHAVFNGSGLVLFALNLGTRNISSYSVNETTGALGFVSVQPVNALGTTGNPSAMAYLPTVFTVTNANNSGAGSLRQAAANATGVDSGAMVIFQRPFFSTPRTIALSTGQISIARHLNIVGPGADLLTVRNTAPFGSTSRVFNIGAGATVGLSGLTISGGNVSSVSGGGGILNNSASGIVNISDCWITDNATAQFGAGILNSGTVTLVNSTVSGNSGSGNAPGGGGIDSIGSLIIRSSTFSGNVRTGTGDANAGALWNGGPLVITGSTFTNNESSTGAAAILTPVAVVRATIRNTIVAGNRNNSTIPDVVGAFAPTDGGFNIIGNVGAATGLNQTGDQTGTGAAPLDPKLVPLLAFKGGTTPVHMPLPDSPAVDKGNNSNLLNDQRRFTRPFDNAAIPNTANGADVGAVERRATESIFVPPFDFDGDSMTDIGIFRNAGQEWWISRSSDNAVLATQFGASGDQIVPGDYTGDGKVDIAFWRPSNGNWFVLRSEDFSFFAFPFGANGDMPAPGDYDGDSKTDAAVFRPSGATWFIRRSSDGIPVIQAFGNAGDQPVPADYDGDGRSDIAIYRPLTGEWWLNRSTSGVVAVQFGGSTDKQVQGDYTGDGKMDVAFWRAGTGEWFVLRSEDLSFFSFPFGLATDIPAPGDYDGDGKHDAAVFRPSSATWFVQRTSAGSLAQQFGATGDRPIPNAFVP